MGNYSRAGVVIKSTSGGLSGSGTISANSIVVNQGGDSIFNGTVNIFSVIGSSPVDPNGSFSKLGSGKLVFAGSSSALPLDAQVNFVGGTLEVDSSSFFDSSHLRFSGGTLRYGSSLLSSPTDLSNRFTNDSGQIFRIDTNTAVVTFSSAIDGLNNSLEKLGDGTLALTSNTNSFSGPTSVNAGTLEISAGIPNSAVLISSGSTLATTGFSSEVGSFSGDGNIAISASGVLVSGSDNTNTTFSGAISGPGDLQKIGSGSLTLSGSSPSFGSNNSIDVVAGELIIADANAIGSGNNVFVAPAATLSLQSNESIPSNFSFSNQIRLDTGLGGESVLKLASGSAQITQPIEINNDARILLPASGSELLLDDLSPASASSMLSGIGYGYCLTSSPCQLVIEGPGAGGAAIVKTFRKDLGAASTDAAFYSEGISLYTDHGSDISLVDLKLTDNIIFRLSGDSVFSGLDAGSSPVASTIEINDAELQIFPDVSLGSLPHSQVIKSSAGSLNPGTMTFLSDASNGSNNAFTSLANTVSHPSGEARYKVESGVTVDLLRETVTGSGDLVKEGAGELAFRGGNTGSTFIKAGSLKLDSIAGGISSDLHDATAVSVDSGAVFDVDVSDVIGSISGSGDIELASGVILSAGADNSSSSFEGVISGAGGFSKQGSGTLNFSGSSPNTYSGGTSVEGGTLQLSGGSGLADGSGLSVRQWSDL